jgi:predicted nucleotidyltransferase
MKATVQIVHPRPAQAARRRRGRLHDQAPSAPPRRAPLGGFRQTFADEDGLIPQERIQAYCDAVGREFRPSKIILFGSYAYGKPGPDSDVDLLVVMPFRGSDVTKAIQIRSRFDTPFPMDLIVRKPEFVAQRQQERDMFIELVVSQGQVLYESQHA